MKKTAFLLLSTVFLLNQCTKPNEVTLDALDVVMSKVNYTCSSVNPSTFFSAQVGENDFCITSDNANPAAKANTGVGLSFVPISGDKFKRVIATFYTDRGDISYKPIFVIEGPADADDVNLSNIELCDKYLKKNTDFPLQSIADNDSKKFRVSLMVHEYQPKNDDGTRSGSIYTHTTLGGDQNPDAKLVFEEVERIENAQTVTFNVKGRFNCSLYRQMAPNIKGKLYKNIQNATFKYAIVLPK